MQSTLLLERPCMFFVLFPHSIFIYLSEDWQLVVWAPRGGRKYFWTCELTITCTVNGCTAGYRVWGSMEGLPQPHFRKKSQSTPCRGGGSPAETLRMSKESMSCSPYCESGAFKVHISTHIILTITLCSGFSYYSNFIDKNTGSGKMTELARSAGSEEEKDVPGRVSCLCQGWGQRQWDLSEEQEEV